MGADADINGTMNIAVITANLGFDVCGSVPFYSVFIRAARADTPQLPVALTCMIFFGNGAPGAFGPRVFWMVFFNLIFYP